MSSNYSLQPLISICIPNLNNGAFLQARFESILQQTYSNLEIIFVDSASTDNSWEIAQNYAKKDSRIKLIQHPPRGLYLNWNVAISHTTGDFVHIATADDTCDPTFLEKAITPLLTYTEIDLVQVQLSYINEQGHTLDNSFISSFYQTPIKDYINIPHIRYAPFDGLYAVSGSIPCSSISQQLFRTSSLKKVGPFSTLFGVIGDFEFQTRVGLMLNKFVIPERLVTWRVHPTQATKQSKDPQKFLDRAAMLKHAFSVCNFSIPPHFWLPLKARTLLNSIYTFKLQYCSNSIPGSIQFLQLIRPKKYITKLLSENYKPYQYLIKITPHQLLRDPTSRK